MFIKCLLSKKNYIYLIIFPIFKIIESILETKVHLDTIFIIPFLKSLANILCIILWIYRIKLNQRTKIKVEEKPKISESIIKEKENKPKSKRRGMSQIEICINEINIKNRNKLIKEYALLVILGLILFCALVINIICLFLFNNENNCIIILFFSLVLIFFFISLFSLFFLKKLNKFYKHQKLTLLLIMFLSIIYVFSSLDYNSKNLKRTIIFFMISEILYSLFYIVGKQYIIFSYKSPFKMIFFSGIICFIMFSIFQFIFIKLGTENDVTKFFIDDLKKINNDIDLNDDHYINIFIFFKEKGVQNLFLIPILIIMLIVNYFEWQILTIFSINHFASSNFLYCFIFPFLIENLDIINIFIFYLFYVLIVFLLLVFNEFVILYFCSLEENTIYEKKLREIKDKNIELGRESLAYDINDEEQNDNELNNPQNEMAITDIN